jgi:hypothetical protein
MATAVSGFAHPAFNGWRLFLLLLVLLSLPLAIAATRADFGQASTVSGFIALSVQVSVPWLYLAFAASALARLFPGDATRWLLRNRRYVGLAYAAGMGWQLVFILWLVTAHIDYYHEVADNPYDLAEELPGYVFLLAMVLTSFRSGRAFLGSRRWHQLHTVGIYYLWGETWSTYWWYAFYYEEPRTLYFVYFWMGLAAWGLRLTAWQRARTGRVEVPGATDRVADDGMLGGATR